MSRIYVRDYVGSWFDGNRDWLADEIRDAAIAAIKERGVTAADLTTDDVTDFYTRDGAISDIKDEIANDVEWEVESEVEDMLDDLVREVLDDLVDYTPESEED